ncbi:MAG: NAD(P)H-binding protein [Kineosporiaceae bacterium]
MTGIDLVTGAFGYSGTYLRRALHDRGRQVRTLTNHPPAVGGKLSDGSAIEIFPYTFDDPQALRRAFEGVETFYNTYWVRYAPGGTSYAQAVANTKVLFEAAREAGVRRIVHVSITNPDPDSFYEYYRGKAALERHLVGLGVPYAIVRPSVIFGGEDIFINNIAWLVRRFHVFAIPGDGRYRLRPVYVADLAALCVELGSRPDGDPDVTIDAVGPQDFTFEDLVGTVAEAVGTHWWPVHLPPAVVAVILRGLSVLTRDVVLTRDEIDGLMASLVTTDGEATCPTRLTDYLREHAAQVGASYHSELDRRRPAQVPPAVSGTFPGRSALR